MITWYILYHLFVKPKLVYVGKAGYYSCRHCHNSGEFDLYKTDAYKSKMLPSISSASRQEKYFIVCSFCKKREQVSKQTFDEYLAANGRRESAADKELDAIIRRLSQS